MSFTDGSGLFGELAHILRKAVPDRESRREVYDHMLDAFIDIGWEERPDELKGSDPVLDEVLEERYPDEIEVEDLDEEEDFE